jgi:hypothetical protein
MSQSLEIEVIVKFVAKDKQSRYIQFVSSEKSRNKFINDLSHFSHFKWELLDELHKDEAKEVEQRLKSLNISSKECYVISENPEIDQRILPFEKAFEEIGGRATILVFGHAKMIYFEGEPPKNKYVSKIH